MAGIVIGVDGSDGAASALRWAARESQLRGWPVTAVMAWGFLEQHQIDTHQFDPSYGEAQASEDLDTILRTVLGDETATTVERRVTLDLATTALLEASEEADLLVVGARGLGGFRGLLLGSVSQACLHRAKCPVAVIRGDIGVEPTEYGRIVVGVDGSTGAQAALDWALDEARARTSQIAVVHGWNAVYGGAGYPYAMALDPAPLEQAARGVIAAALERADTSGLAHEPEQLAVIGGSAAALLETTEGADLVVVGTRGMGAFRGMLLGSVSHQVAQHAQCPVVVVPET